MIKEYNGQNVMATIITKIKTLVQIKGQWFSLY